MARNLKPKQPSKPERKPGLIAAKRKLAYLALFEEEQAGPSPSSTSPSPSSFSCSLQRKRPKRDAQWHAMMRRRREYLNLKPKQPPKPKRKPNLAAEKKRVYLAQFEKEQADHKVVVTPKPPDSLENSHGVSWTRVSYIAKGGFGSVFYAERRIDTSGIPSKLAVKSAFLGDSSTLVHEKRVLSDLTACPYLVKCFGKEVTELSNGRRVYNLLLDYCSGLSIHRRIREVSGCSRLPECEVKCYTRHVLLGLEYMHGRGFVHCDIKPGNILLVPDGETTGGFAAKIADFGLTKALVYEDDGLGCIVRGTYRYMSPELVRDKVITYSVDVWALGCSVLEMLTGNLPWDYSEECEVLHMIGYTENLPAVLSSLSELAKDFLDKCLRKIPEKRWTAEMLLNHPFVAVD